MPTPAATTATSVAVANAGVTPSGTTSAITAAMTGTGDAIFVNRLATSSTVFRVDANGATTLNCFFGTALTASPGAGTNFTFDISGMTMFRGQMIVGSTGSSSSWPAAALELTDAGTNPGNTTGLLILGRASNGTTAFAVNRSGAITLNAQGIASLKTQLGIP